MKLKADLLVLCDNAIIANDNKLSIIGIFNEVNVLQFPGGIAKCFLTAIIKGEPSSSHNLLITLKKQHTSKSLLQPLSLNSVISPNGKTNIVVELVGIGFNEPGNYIFAIHDKDHEISSTELLVKDANKNQATRTQKSN